MTNLADALMGFAADEPKSKIFVPAPYAPTWTLRTLAFDQSIANTGWAYFDTEGRVERTGNLKTVEVAKGFEDTLQRTVEIYNQVKHVISNSMDVDLIVHEVPPMGSKVNRGDSSLCAAVAVRIAADEYDVRVHMVGRQRVSKRFTGNGNAKKAEVSKAIKAFLPYLADIKPMNEAIIDAIGVGMVAFEELT